MNPGFQATKRIRIARWFNAEPQDPLSCCQLKDVVAEFQSQGLELDLPIVCWGDDVRWESGGWLAGQPRRRSRLVRDPRQLRINTYLVLLTRGREGVVIFVPPDHAMDATADALRRAGATLLDEDLSLFLRSS